MVNRIICWQPIWNPAFPDAGLERLVIADDVAESVILGIDEDGRSFRVDYRLAWDARWRLREAMIERQVETARDTLHLTSDGAGNWRDGTGAELPHLAGCIDIDIWPTPFTNTFPIRRAPPERLNDRAEYKMAWVNALSAAGIAVQPMRQGYTRLSERLYLYENLDGSFQARLPVDADGLVLDYQGIFRRVAAG